MAQAKMVYDKTEDTRFEWRGGAYIEMFLRDYDTGLHRDTPFDAINVWDYAKDEPRIERTLTAFQEFIDQYIQEVVEDFIAQDPEEF